MSTFVRTLANLIHQRTGPAFRQVPLAVLSLLCFFGGASLAVAQTADKPIQVSLPAGDLADALDRLGAQAGVQIMYEPELAKGIKVNAVNGTLTVQNALTQLLANTVLRADRVNNNTVVLRRAESEKKRESVKGGQGQPTSANQSSQETDEALEEIVVTAQKRTERLQDVPVPVTVLSADTLAENDKSRLEDYFDAIPGFSFAPGILATSSIAFRGISEFGVGGAGPTVAVTVDDLPFSGTIAQIPQVIPDVDPGDLARVEALRGPQGTLYGASSMGGLLKYVTVDPSTAAVSGRVQADVNTVENGSQPGYTFRGSVNVPINDTMAIRASAFTRQDAGYIDNPVLHTDGVNEDHANGGRIAGLWRPSEIFSLKLSALYQNTKAGSNSDVQPEFGDLEQTYPRGCCGYEKQLQAYSANLSAKLGAVDLTAVTGYIVNKFSESYDYTYLFGGFAQSRFGVGGAGDHGYGETKRISQEVRASIPISHWFDWLVGGFYSHDNSPFNLIVPAVDPATGAEVGNIVSENIPDKYTEYAAFTNLTVHITDRFDVQIGGRESHIQQIAEPVQITGALEGSLTVPGAEATTNPFTYLFTPQYKFTPDLMTYARIASGYRPGAFNNFDTNPLIPRAASPDKTRNYEIGFKGDFLNHVLSLDASLYYIDWKDIQISVSDPTNSNVYTTNGSRAKSEGVELSAQARPLAGLSISGWVTYDDAELTEGFPASSTLYGPAGSRLPLSSRFSGSLSLNQTFPLSANVTGFVGGDFSYVGDRLGLFLPPDPNVLSQRQVYPPYAKLNLRGGVNLQSWTVNLYANNVTDRRGVIGGGAGDLPPVPFTLRYIPPRVVGVSVTKTF